MPFDEVCLPAEDSSCVDVFATDATTPLADEGYWYLVRVDDGAVAGTWNEPGFAHERNYDPLPLDFTGCP